MWWCLGVGISGLDVGVSGLSALRLVLGRFGCI